MQGIAQRDEYECRPDQTGPARLVQPDFYLLVDVDDLQKQVNTLENEVHRMKRAEARRKWRYGRKNH